MKTLKELNRSKYYDLRDDIFIRWKPIYMQADYVENLWVTSIFIIGIRERSHKPIFTNPRFSISRNNANSKFRLSFAREHHGIKVCKAIFQGHLSNGLPKVIYKHY